MKKQKMTMFSVSLKVKEKKKLDKMVKQQKMKRSAFVREAIKRHLDRV